MVNCVLLYLLPLLKKTDPTMVPLRLVDWTQVGLEGTGHHLLKAAFSDMLKHSGLPYVNVCDLSTELYPGLVASLSNSPLAYAQV